MKSYRIAERAESNYIYIQKNLSQVTLTHAHGHMDMHSRNPSMFNRDEHIHNGLAEVKTLIP